MKYIVKNKKSYEYVSDNELLHLLLKQRGVENPELLLNLTPDVLHGELEQPFMEFGIKLLHYHISNNNRIHIINSRALGQPRKRLADISNLRCVVTQTSSPRFLSTHSTV